MSGCQNVVIPGLLLGVLLGLIAGPSLDVLLEMVSNPRPVAGGDSCHGAISGCDCRAIGCKTKIGRNCVL